MTGRGAGGRGAPWSGWDPLDALIGTGLVLIGMILVGAITVGVTAENPEETLVFQFLLAALFVGVPLIIATTRTRDQPWRLAGFNRFRARDLLLVLAALVAQIGALALVSAIVMPEQQPIIEDNDLDATTLSTVLAVIAVVVAGPIGEEAFFRGLIFGALRSRLSFAGAALISGLLFGSVHLPTGDFAVAAVLSFLGVLLAFLYERTGSLGPPIALHMANNGIAITLLLS